MNARNGTARISSVTARLDKLEVRAGLAPPPPPITPPAQLFLRYALAVLAGGASGDEAPADGFARALGYALTSDFKDALKDRLDGKAGGPDDLDARYRRATHALWRDLGLDPDKPDAVEFILTAEPLIRAAPDSGARRQALEALEMLDDA